MENRIEKIDQILERFKIHCVTCAFLRQEPDIEKYISEIDALYSQPSDQELREKIVLLLDGNIRSVNQNESYKKSIYTKADQILALISHTRREEVEPLQKRIVELEAAITEADRIIKIYCRILNKCKFDDCDACPDRKASSVYKVLESRHQEGK